MSNENKSEETGIEITLPAKVLTDLRAVPVLQAVNSVNLEMSNREAMLDVIRSHAPDPTIFDEFPPYVWAAEISSDRKDYHFTRMDPATTLKNFVEDAIEGVTFLDSHEASEKLGRSFASALVSGENLTQVFGAFYTIPDVSTQRSNTSDLIKRIRSGIEKDVSVGFKRGENFMMRCSICGRDMFRDWDCDHFYGMTERVWDDENEEWREVKVYATIVDGRLAEVSGVHDGSAPGAMIEKALDFAKRGLLKPEVVPSLERQLRMVLPTKKTFNVGAPKGESERQTTDSTESNNSKQGDNFMANENDKPQANPSLDFVRSVLTGLGLVSKEEEVSSVTEGVRALQTEIKNLRGIKQERDSFFEAEIEEARKEGVAAYGDKFDTDRWIGTEEKPGLLRRGTLSEIRATRKDWTEVADAALGSSRRSTESNDDKEGAEETAGDKTNEEQRSTKPENKEGEPVRAVENLFD